VSLKEFLRRPEINMAMLKRLGLHDGSLDPASALRLENEIKYEGYINKQSRYYRYLVRLILLGLIPNPIKKPEIKTKTK
jgi:tRNA U34 5-carboxymethylaminomethyl modifying enzyme MnmG/GidA